MGGREPPWQLFKYNHQGLWKRVGRFDTAQRAMRYADKHYRRGRIWVLHKRTKVRWVRNRGQWQMDESPSARQSA